MALAKIIHLFTVLGNLKPINLPIKLNSSFYEQSTGILFLNYLR